MFESPTLPFTGKDRPPLALKRVHLRRVGPDGARFDPLDLDMTSAGRAADKVLWQLTNTGGKSTLITLISSVVVPGARDQVGGANIGEYVQTGDTSHVALEWESDQMGPFVTGVVYEWPNRVRPAGTPRSELKKMWYFFRSAKVGIDDLPFTDESGRRQRTFEDFRSAALALFSPPATQAATEWTYTTIQGEWLRVLETRTPLDPELFRYQNKMNNEEGGADALVAKLNTADAVVRFFIEMLNDTDSLGDFAATLKVYAEHAAKRGEWELDLGFCQALASAVAELETAHTGLVAARAEERSRAAGAAELAADISQRATVEEARVERLAVDLASERETHETLNRDINRYDLIRAQLLLEQARFDEAAAEAADNSAGTAEAIARDEADAWRNVEVIIDRSVAQIRADEAQAAYDSAEKDLAPLRDATTTAGAALAAKLGAMADEATRSAGLADQAADGHRAAVGAAELRREEAQRRAAQTENQLEVVRKTVDDAAGALRRLQAEGHADPGETPTAARDRWRLAHEQAAERSADAERRRREAGDELGRLRPELDAARTEAAEAAQAHAAAEAELGRYRVDLAALAGAEEVAELSGDSPIEDPEAADRLTSHARELAGRADEAAGVAQLELERVLPELAALESGDLLATSRDIDAVRRALLAAGIGAVTGWDWVSRNIADVEARRATIALRPDVANGVIVSDPAQMGTARQALETAVPDLRMAVLVAADPDLAGPGPSDGFVIEPHRAVFDPDWAARMIDELTARRDELTARLASARAAASRHRQAQALLGEFSRRWQETTEAGLAEAAAGAEAESVTAARHVYGLEERRRLLETDRETAREHKEQAEQTVADIRVRLAAVEAAVELAGRAAREVDRRDGLERALRDERQEAEAARREKGQAQERLERALRDAAEWRAQASAHRRHQAEVRIAPAEAVPRESFDELQAVWDERRRLLTEAEAGSDHAARLSNALEDLAERASRVAAIAEDTRRRAEQIAGTFEASSAESRAQHRSAAEARLREAQAAKAETAQHLRSAHQAVTDRQPREGRVHTNLGPEWTPGGREDAARLIDDVEARNNRAREDLRQAQGRIDAFGTQLQAARSAAERFSAAAEIWTGPPAQATRTYSGAPDEARNDILAAVRTANRAADEALQADKTRAGALRATRDAALDPKWVAVTTPIKERCRADSDDTLAEAAAEWGRSLQARMRSLSDDLADLDRHRDVLVTQLVTLTRTQLRRIRQVTTCSRLPEGLGGVSGQPALQIHFDPAPEDEARGRLAQRVDDWARTLGLERRSGGAAQRIEWLAQAVSDAVRHGPSGPWRVQVLKPPVDDMVAYRTPDRIPVEYSGGQELTLAVLLYCALAKVRAQNRTGGERPPGVVIMDNPFGKASNPRLIRLQQALAAQSQLQLICATGIEDPAVISAFDGERSRILRLRNDKDQRSGLKFLRIDPNVAPEVTAAVTGGRPLDAEQGWVSAVGYSVRR